jgi:hypothetical protein
MPPVPFRVHADPIGGRVEVDGQDVTDHVRALHLDVGSNEVSTLVLELVPGTGPIEGVAIVQGIVGDPAATIVEFLASIDPSDLERQALAGDLASGVIPAVLEVLARMAREHPWI